MSTGEGEPSQVKGVFSQGSMWMPLPGQLGAPFFDGKNVRKFLREWKYATRQCGLSHREQIEDIVHYVDDSLCRTIESLEAYCSGSWDRKEFCRQMEEEFDD